MLHRRIGTNGNSLTFGDPFSLLYTQGSSPDEKDLQGEEQPSMEANELQLSMEVKGVFFLGICFVVLAVGISLAVLRWKWRRKQLRRLQIQGRRVIARVTQVQQECEERGPDAFALLNYCYYIQAQWIDPQTGRTYCFQSNRLTSRPKEYLPGAFVHVLMDDSTHSTRYLMELPEYDMIHSV
jgi:hypothetical protein